VSEIPDKVEIGFDLLKQLFDTVGVDFSVPPTEEEFQSLVIKVQERFVMHETQHAEVFEPICNLLSIDKPEKSAVSLIDEDSVLVVDDLVMVTYQLSMLLSKMGYKVTLARSAPEAISLLKRNQYKYILMDFYMPEKEDGMLLLNSINTKITQEKSDTKVIIMSGMADAKSVEYCLNNGAHSFVEKNEDWKKEITACLTKFQSV
jgi:CheY-like chemotaxis protein